MDINKINEENILNVGEIRIDENHVDYKEDAIACLQYLYPGNGERLYESFIKNDNFMQDLVRIELKRSIYKIIDKIVERVKQYDNDVTQLPDVTIISKIYEYILLIYDQSGLSNNIEITSIILGNPGIYDSSPISDIVSNLKECIEKIEAKKLIKPKVRKVSKK